MNIVIVGCGNIGFETAKQLCSEHTLLLINHSCPEDVAQFVQKHDNVWFSLADATDQSSMEAALTKYNGKFNRVDALVSTVGASCPTSAIDDIEQFKSEFHLNFFGNLVPIQAVLKQMLPVGSGRIVVISSTSGVFAYPGLKAYVPAKWALTNFCRNLRDKIKQHGIYVDIVFPASIKNQRSRTFLFEDGIEPEKVAIEITRILKGKKNNNRFVPRRYVLLHTLERLFPRVLDIRAGLQRKRRKLFRDQKVDSVLITGASSELGKRLAMVYAKTAKRLYLLGSNEQALSEVKRLITCSSDCKVDEVYLDLADCRTVASLVDRIESVELIINNTEFSISDPLDNIPIPDYELCLNNNLFGAVNLVAEFLRKQVPPVKIINIIPMAAKEDRCRFGCHSAGQAALWAFTRSLRRTFGNKIQVMEVILAKQQENYCGADATTEVEDHVKYEHGCHQSGKAMSIVVPLIAQVAARQIHEFERQGREVVFFPFRYKLYMYLAAILPWRLG